MDLQAAARFLNVSEATLRRWVRQGLVDGSGPRGERFDEHDLERWARERGLSVERAPSANAAPPADLLADAVERGTVLTDAHADTASRAIELCIEALTGFDAARRAELRAEVLERERMASTAMGHGIALPHPRRPPSALVSEPIVCVGFPAEPIDWAAPDGERVHTFMLLLSPSAPVHLELLSRIAQVLRDPELQAFLRERPSRPELVARLRELKKHGA